MEQYRYYCKNCTCGQHSETGKLPEFFIDKTDDSSEPCPNSLDKENEDIVELYQVGKVNGFAISTFAGKRISNEEKKKMLKDRATGHYNKEIKERKAQMWKDTFKPKT